MITQWISVCLSLAATVIALHTTSEYLDDRDLPEAVRRTRSHHVLEKNWARVDNWRLDQKLPPCQWSAARSFPFFGSYTVHCQISASKALVFEISSDFQTIAPHDQATRTALEAMMNWARLKKRWP